MGINFLNQSSSSEPNDSVEIPATSISQLQAMFLARQTKGQLSSHASVHKSTFIKLPGEVYALLGDFLNEKLPLFIFTNRLTFKVSLHYQIGYYEH